ncbi:collagen alpha-1(I) chain-like [Anser cygnoides]|uniref:collagen alpha-1(I) chain-like n=1 Tax=Anser cygnoides TaxID=8845 RepID=UPI0034D17803
MAGGSTRAAPGDTRLLSPPHCQPLRALTGNLSTSRGPPRSRPGGGAERHPSPPPFRSASRDGGREPSPGRGAAGAGNGASAAGPVGQQGDFQGTRCRGTSRDQNTGFVARTSATFSTLPWLPARNAPFPEGDQRHSQEACAQGQQLWPMGAENAAQPPPGCGRHKWRDSHGRQLCRRQTPGSAEVFSQAGRAARARLARLGAEKEKKKKGGAQGSKHGPLGTPRPFLHPRNRNSGVLGARRTIFLPQGHAGQPRCRPGVPTVGDGWDAAFATPAVLAQVHRPGRGRAAAASPSCFFASFLLVKSWATRGERSPRQAARWGCGWVLAARSCPRSAPRARLSSARPRVPLSPSGAPRDRGFVPSPGPAHAGVPARERRQRHHASPNAPGHRCGQRSAGCGRFGESPAVCDSPRKPFRWQPVSAGLGCSQCWQLSAFPEYPSARPEGPGVALGHPLPPQNALLSRRSGPTGSLQHPTYVLCPSGVVPRPRCDDSQCPAWRGHPGHLRPRTGGTRAAPAHRERAGQRRPPCFFPPSPSPPAAAGLGCREDASPPRQGEMSRQGTGTERWEKAGGRGKRGEERRKKGKKGKKGEKGEKGKKGKKSLFLGIGPALDPGLRDVQQDTERAAGRESAQECAVTGATRSRLLNDLERFFSSKTDPKARHPRGRGAEGPAPAAWPGNPPELCPGGSGARVRPVGARSRASPAGSQPPSAGSRLPPGEHEGCPLPGPSLVGCPGFSGRFPPSRPGFLARPVGRQGFPRSRRAKLFVPPL